MEYARAAIKPGLLEVNAPLIDEQAEHRGLVDRAGAERVAERVVSATSALLAVSAEVAEYLERFPSARGKGHVVPNGVDPERFPANLAPALPASAGTFTIGFVGSLKPWHGLEFLLEAFARLNQRASNTAVNRGDGAGHGKIAPGFHRVGCRVPSTSRVR